MTAGADITTTDYSGNYIYQNNVLQMISQPEGYIEPNTQGDFDYIYQYKDHLGNIRLSYKDDELYDTDFNEGVYSPWQASVNTTSMTIEDDRLKVVTGVHLNGANGYYDLLAGETYEISVDVDRDMFTTDLEFSFWKGNSKIYGEYITASKTVTYEYTPSITATYRINFRLRDYGYAGGDQTFYLDNVIIRNTVLALIEENNYYPFGLKHEGYNTTVSSNTNAVATKFKYNGKELNDELGLDLYDYGARFYDGALGRWHVLDPLAEDYYSWTTYNYVANNPIYYIDPDGRGWKEAKVLLKSSATVTFSIGAQLGAQVGKFSAKLNVMSYNFEADGNGDTKSYASSGFSLGIPALNVSKEATYTKETTEEIGNVKLNVAGNESSMMIKTKTDVETTTTSTSVNVFAASVTVTVENVKTSDNQGRKTDNTSSDINGSAGVDVINQITNLEVSAIVGVKAEVNVKKLWAGIKELFK